MAVYIVATRRSMRGKAPTAREALADLAGFRIMGASNPDIVVIEVTPQRAEMLRREIGQSYIIEREKLHHLASRPAAERFI